MRKKIIGVICSSLLIVLLAILPLTQASATKEAPADWAWLVSQVKSGRKQVTLPCNIVRDSDVGLLAESPVTIVGGGFTITDCIVDGGQITFDDVQIKGIHGYGDEDGGTGLTVRGDGTIVIFSGATEASGGRSGPSGERGGDGILLTGEKQGILLHDKTLATGGTGNFIGGCGIRITGCGSSALLAGDAGAIGHAGLAEGGAGISAPGCTEITVRERAAANGGSSPYAGAGGVHSLACDACEKRGAVTIRQSAILTSGNGAEGGSAVYITREAPGESADLIVLGMPMLIGGGGSTAGSAVRAEGCLVDISGEGMLFSGNYFEKESPILRLEGCEEAGDRSGVLEEAGIPVASNPANNISALIRAELDRTNERYVPKLVENGLTTRELKQKLGGNAVDSGRVSKLTLNGKTLLISMYNETYEKRLQYTPRLSTDDAEGLRLVLIASTSAEWITLESTVAALRKLYSSGFTQFAYTTVDPVYLERILDLALLLEAIDADENPPETILIGTADDEVIFPRGKNEWDYQVGLMDKIRVTLPELEEAAEGDPQ